MAVDDSPPADNGAGGRGGSERQHTAWVPVLDAAAAAAIDSGIVRRWYRAGRIPTRRGEGGAFLVPLDAILALAAELMEHEDAPRPDEPDEEGARLEAAYWAEQARAAREDAAAARQDALEAVEARRAAEEQLAFLRTQLAEAAEENRNLRASVGSITDFSWLERTRPYESPVRPQERLGTALSGLLADVRKDDADVERGGGGEADAGTAVATPQPEPADADADADADGASSGSLAERLGEDVPPLEEAVAPALVSPRHDYGANEDDVLPTPDRKGRRRG